MDDKRGEGKGERREKGRGGKGEERGGMMRMREEEGEERRE